MKDEVSMRAEWRKIDNRTWIVGGGARGKATVIGTGPYTVRVELPEGRTYDAPFEFGDLPAALEWAMREVAPQTDDLGLDSD
jgi:hypothetical protein